MTMFRWSAPSLSWTSIEVRSLRSRGSSDLHTLQRQPIVGIPTLVPEPSTSMLQAGPIGRVDCRGRRPTPILPTTRREPSRAPDGTMWRDWPATEHSSAPAPCGQSVAISQTTAAAPDSVRLGGRSLPEAILRTGTERGERP